MGTIGGLGANARPITNVTPTGGGEEANEARAANTPQEEQNEGQAQARLAIQQQQGIGNAVNLTA